MHAWVLHLVTSAHSHVCRLLLTPPPFPLNMSVTALAFLHPPSTKHLMSSARSRNRRLWNMKRSYIRRIQSAAESRALFSVCVQENRLPHTHKHAFKHSQEYAVNEVRLPAAQQPPVIFQEMWRIKSWLLKFPIFTICLQPHKQGRKQAVGKFIPLIILAGIPELGQDFRENAPSAGLLWSSNYFVINQRHSLPKQRVGRIARMWDLSYII